MDRNSGINRRMKSQMNHRGFSLVELLVVITIIAILVGLSTSFTSDIQDSIELATTSGEVVTILNQARETALATNQNIEVRFYLNASEFSDEPDEYNLIGVGSPMPPSDPDDPNFDDPEQWEFKETIAKFSLPRSTFIRVDDPSFSPVITADEELGVRRGTEDDPVRGQLAYSSISFTTDNQASLDPDQDWTLIIVNRSDSTKSLAEINFATLQLFPRTGRVVLIQK